MFTGIVREIGTVEEVERSEGGASLRVRAGLAAELAAGDSVSVSGACLTVSSTSDGAFEADVMNQTLSLTTLGGLEAGAPSTSSRRCGRETPSAATSSRDTWTAPARSGEVSEDGFARRLRLAAPRELERFIVERGSVTVDGVSLTVAALAEDGFEVSLIPETLERTTLGELAEGSRVNLEVDVIARYAERLMQGFETKEGE